MTNAPRMDVSRVPSKPVRRDESGALVVDLWLSRDAEFASDLSLGLTPAEAEVLHAQLCYVLDDETAHVITPPSKLPGAGRAGAEGLDGRPRRLTAVFRIRNTAITVRDRTPFETGHLPRVIGGARLRIAAPGSRSRGGTGSRRGRGRAHDATWS
ncbi:hypothetical protein [Streptomyces beigongshangae]|uniref:hypothetical protein n=1 Tax=Streptomyces beigongshangae TaxID=2841597 RepID=UPI001C84B18E|nr:hypothetical protein [Streptomyces sp. REN17]